MKEQAESDRALHACRIIPERGSWTEINVTKKDLLAIRIDQSSKIPATCFLRAMDPAFETVFLTPTDHLSCISSSLVREIASLDGDVSKFVHPVVRNALLGKFSS